MKTAVIAAGTGLMGKQLLTLVLASNTCNKVIALTRTPLTIDHPKFQNILPGEQLHNMSI